MAYGVLLAGVIVEPFIEYRITRLHAGGAVLEAAWRHVFGPLMRAALIAAFVLIAYPALIGVRSAPPLAILLEDSSIGITGLLNMLFVLSVVLPIVVRPLRRPGLIVPIQGLVATAVVFSWFTAYLGADRETWARYDTTELMKAGGDGSAVDAGSPDTSCSRVAISGCSLFIGAASLSPQSLASSS